MTGSEDTASAHAAPSAEFRERLLKLAGELAAGGAPAGAEALRNAIETWWTEQRALERDLARLLEMHHEINNALAGVRGHAQLLLLGPVATDPKVRERLEVIIRESGRIENAARSLREIRGRLGKPDAASRAA